MMKFLLISLRKSWRRGPESGKQEMGEGDGFRRNRTRTNIIHVRANLPPPKSHQHQTVGQVQYSSFLNQYTFAAPFLPKVMYKTIKNRTGPVRGLPGRMVKCVKKYGSVCTLQKKESRRECDVWATVSTVSLNIHACMCVQGSAANTPGRPAVMASSIKLTAKRKQRKPSINHSVTSTHTNTSVCSFN